MHIDAPCLQDRILDRFQSLLKLAPKLGKIGVQREHVGVRALDVSFPPLAFPRALDLRERIGQIIAAIRSLYEQSRFIARNPTIILRVFRFVRRVFLCQKIDEVNRAIFHAPHFEHGKRDSGILNDIVKPCRALSSKSLIAGMATVPFSHKIDHASGMRDVRSDSIRPRLSFRRMRHVRYEAAKFKLIHAASNAVISRTASHAPHVSSLTQCALSITPSLSRPQSTQTRIYPGACMSKRYCTMIRKSKCLRGKELIAEESIPNEVQRRLLLLACVEEAIDTPGLVEEFNRLFGHKLGVVRPRSGIEALVDQVTGFDPHDTPEQHENMKAFVEFVDEYVVRRIDWSKA